MSKISEIFENWDDGLKSYKVVVVETSEFVYEFEGVESEDKVIDLIDGESYKTKKVLNSEIKIEEIEKEQEDENQD